MPEILPAKIAMYVDGLLPRRDAVLTNMERFAKKHGIPIIGPACGRLLYLVARLSGAKRIFEMGSAIGYSAIWLARAAGPGAEIYYTDGDAENARLARQNFQLAGVEDQIQLLVGDAVELIDTLPGKFDLILIDVDKEQYPAALRKASGRLGSGGVLLADNVLWYGRVAGKAKDNRTRSIRQFNRMIYSSRDLFPVIIPLRDGVAVCLKT